jgi:hypothetical protein
MGGKKRQSEWREIPKQKEVTISLPLRADGGVIKRRLKRVALVPAITLPEPHIQGPVRFLEVKGCLWSTATTEAGLHLFCNDQREERSSYCTVHRAMNRRVVQPKISRETIEGGRE